ncbi:MAG: exopolysaccharide biosynthesis polyprenyl glycosylphosphotransferase [Deltaproteobacteria bacterium]|nr:exopolysaccharide biosynthesis polyprenyl glycosylphosphotransferase [Deltaproteobacteria bacterium]
MEQRRNKALRKIIYVFDGVIVVLSLVLAFVLHTYLRDMVPFLKATPSLNEYLVVAVFTLPLWLFLVPVFRLQQVFERLWTVTQIAIQLIKLHLAALVILTFVLFLTQTVVNRSLVSLFLICTFMLMFIERTILGLRLRYTWRHGHARPRMILAGKPDETMSGFLLQIKTKQLKPEIIGRISVSDSQDQNVDSFEELPPLLGKIDSIEQLLHETSADQVLFFPPFNNPADAASALNVCENLGVSARFAIDLSQPGLATPRIVSLYDYPFITFEAAPKTHEHHAIKHGLDAVLAAVGLVLLSPLFLFVSLLVLVSMGRPVFFSQERAGQFGRKFRMLKFRTMRKGAEKEQDNLLDENEMSGPVFKITDDPRVTPLGRFLRRSSIDELPQLVNVLRGTMSLVGPRPLPIVEQQKIYGWHRRRLSMRPGITGLWQVSGRNNIDFTKWMKLDLKYVDEWSLGLDALLLLKTIRAVISKTGAN